MLYRYSFKTRVVERKFYSNSLSVSTLILMSLQLHTTLQEHGAEEVSKWRLVRVDENFRVIALGLPVPRYSGQPLDPPLRSRFQARDVATIGFGVS